VADDDSLDESLQDEEVLRGIIKKTIVGICDKKKNAYPNICAYGSRSTLDVDSMVEKTFNYMTTETLPMDLEGALNMVDCELGGGFGD
jgi:hypothetical protein